MCRDSAIFVFTRAPCLLLAIEITQSINALTVILPCKREYRSLYSGPESVKPGFYGLTHLGWVKPV